MMALFDGQATRLDRYWREAEGARSVASKKDASTLRTQYRVADFVDWKKGDALVLNPNFQRRPVMEERGKVISDRYDTARIADADHFLARPSHRFRDAESNQRRS